MLIVYDIFCWMYEIRIDEDESRVLLVVVFVNFIFIQKVLMLKFIVHLC